MEWPREWRAEGGARERQPALRPSVRGGCRLRGPALTGAARAAHRGSGSRYSTSHEPTSVLSRSGVSQAASAAAGGGGGGGGGGVSGRTGAGTRSRATRCAERSGSWNRAAAGSSAPRRRRPQQRRVPLCLPIRLPAYRLSASPSACLPSACLPSVCSAVRLSVARPVRPCLSVM